MAHEQQLLEEIARLKDELAANESTIAALMKRVESDINAAGNAFSLFESNILLQQSVNDRTEQLEEANQHLKAEIQQRVQAMETAMSASRAKSQFLTNMSHEIRTPLNGVIGIAELAMQLEKGTETGEHLQVIHGSAKTLLGIVNGILDLSRIEAGHLELREAPLDLGQLVQDVVQTHRADAQEKALSLDLALGSTDPVLISVDAQRLRQVLDCFIGNAVKFTHTGGVTVELDWDTSSDDKINARICITDTGIGIDPKDHDRIFGMFTQADESMTRRFGGTGMGLAISRSIIELMGGTVLLASKPDYGTTITCQVSFNRPGRQHVHASSTTAETTGKAIQKTSQSDPSVDLDSHVSDDEASQRVLLIEDNLVGRRLMTGMLERNGYKVDAADDLEGAFALKASCRYLGVFVSGTALEVDVSRIVQTLQAHQDGEPVLPVVALISAGDGIDRAGCLAAGLNDCCDKPVSATDVRQVLDRWRAGARPEKELCL